MAYESKWLKASKALEYYIYGGPWAPTPKDAEYQLYHAVLDQEVRARIDGQLLTDMGVIRGKSFSDDRRYVLPFNMEVNLDDVARIWDKTQYDLADLIARNVETPASAEIKLETIHENLAVLFKSVDSRLAAMPLEQALEETSFHEKFAQYEREHKLLIGSNLIPEAKRSEFVGAFNSFLSGKYMWSGTEGEAEPQKGRGGRKPVYDWAVVFDHVKSLFEHHGPLSPDDPDWSCQADVERAMQKFCLNRFGREPAVSTVREKAQKFIKNVSI